MSDTIDSLQIEIKQDAQGAIRGLEELSKTLKKLQGVASGVEKSLDKVNFDKFGQQMRKLATALQPLQGFKSQAGGLIDALKGFDQVANDLIGFSRFDQFAEQIKHFVTSLEPLKTLGQVNLRSILSPLKELPAVMEALTSVDLDAFAGKIAQVTAALSPLSVALEHVTSRMKTIPSVVNKVNTSFVLFARGGLMRTIGKLTIFGYSLRRIASIMSDWVMSSNAYVENLHLLRLTMGDAADEALRFANVVQDQLGIDAGAWIRYQAVFHNMATGFGIASDKAAIMSKNLTQLGYDLSAVFNVDYDTAMRKLESALAGQPRPMREWGFDLSEATLKMVALEKGIKKNVENMTQMEKAQLRFVYLMETARKQNYFGDMARTIMTPANALRILNQQVALLKRALGDALVPLLMRILPYLIATVRALADVMRSIALLLGFELPTIDYDTGISTIAADAEEANEAAKKLRRTLMGFDEVNVLQQDTGVGPIDMGGDLGLDLSKYGYDMLEPLKEVENAMGRLHQSLTKVLQVVLAIGLGFASWKIAQGVINFITLMKTYPIIAVVSAAALLASALADLYIKNEAFRKAVDHLWNRLTSALAPAVEWLGDRFQWLKDNVLAPLRNYITTAVIEAFEKLKLVATWLWQEALVPLARIIQDMLIVAFDGLVWVGSWLWKYVLEPLVDFIKDSLIPGFYEVADAVGPHLQKFFEGFIKVIEFLWYDVLKPFVLWLGDTFGPVFEAVGEAVRDIIQRMRTIFEGFIKFITGVFTVDWKKAWEDVKQIFKRIFASLWGIVKPPFNLIIDGINWIIDGLNKLSITIPDWFKYIPGLSGLAGKTWGINIKPITPLAKGGITNGPMIALVGDNPGGREVVSPLDELTDIVASAVGTAVLQAMQVSGGSGQDRPIILKIDGREIARATIPGLDSERSRTGGLQVAVRPM